MTPIEQNISKWVDELLAIRETADWSYLQVENMPGWTEEESHQAQLIIALVEMTAKFNEADTYVKWTTPSLRGPALSGKQQDYKLPRILKRLNLSPDKYNELKARMEKIGNE